jgi:hypothetical protein
MATGAATIPAPPAAGRNPRNHVIRETPMQKLIAAAIAAALSLSAGAAFAQDKKDAAPKKEEAKKEAPKKEAAKKEKKGGC